jgi:hypothetical protein
VGPGALTALDLGNYGSLFARAAAAGLASDLTDTAGSMFNFVPGRSAASEPHGERRQPRWFITQSFHPSARAWTGAPGQSIP